MTKRPEITLDTIFKIVIMAASGIAISTFFFTFETKDAASESHQRLQLNIEAVEERATKVDTEIKTGLQLVNTKLDGLKTILIRRR